MNANDAPPQPARPRPPRLSASPPAWAGGPPGDGDRLESTEVVGADWSASAAQGWGLVDGRLRSARAGRARWTGVRWADVVADGCDFANGDWTAAGLQRVELRDCRLTGANLSEGRLADVRLSGCKMDGLVGQQLVCVACRFERCDLRDADFEGADLRGVAFHDCDLRCARLAGAKLDGTDFRASRLAGLFADPARLRGAVIDAGQAVELVTLLGVRIGPAVR